MDAVAITFDVDWAPDWAIDLCRRLCRQHGRTSTFFATHESDLLSDLVSDEMVEVGIHPNFLPNSTHGSIASDVMRHCLELVPNAKSMRTHCLVQSSPILATTAIDFLQIETDVSLLLPLHGGLMPTDLYPEGGQRITRLPYFWEDDLLATWPGWDWETAEPITTRGG